MALTLCLLGFIGIVGIFVYYGSQLPPIDQIAVPKRPPNIAILAADGALIANRGETGGSAIKIEDLPPYLPNAFIAIEDRRFRSHFGIDPKGIARAIYRNFSGSGVSLQGGSTLTQQLAKNLFLTQERTASRKIQEAILAFWLERKYTKDQILELYLNRVYFGSGAYGIEAAAQRYYAKSATEVTLAEAAVLAGLVQSPSRLAPNRNPQAAQARAELVLQALQENGLAPGRMIKEALANPAKPVRKPGVGSGNYAADYVMDVIDDFIGTIDTDIVVATTIDSTMQRAAENALVNELNAKGAQYNVSQGALVSMRPDGAIKALVGGRDYAASQFNRATTARRQPGSSFKPFVYLDAVEYGLTPDTVRDDAPINIKGWRPENYSRTYNGPTSLREALALSLNTVAVRLCVEVGPKSVVQTARRLGITSPLQPNASIALGTSEVTPLEMTAAYAAFANGGRGVVPYIINAIGTNEGVSIYSRKGVSSFGQVIDPTSLAMMNDMLHETFRTGTARNGDIPGWEAGGKTGTSQDWRDAWFIGFTGSLVTTVWLGNDDGTPTKRASGGNLPVELWANYMKTALKGAKPVALPGLGWSTETRTAATQPQGQPVGAHPSAPVLDQKDRNFFERLFGL